MQYFTLCSERRRHLPGAGKPGSPLVTREESVALESRSFLSKFFQGATGALVAHFCEQGSLSDAELAELERLIADKRSARKKNKK